MRFPILPVALLLAAAMGRPTNLFVGTAMPAAAQVTVNPKALEPLGGGKQPSTPAAGEHAKTSPPPTHRRHAAAAQRHPAPSKPEHPPVPAHATVSPPGPRSIVRAPPVVPPAPPPPVALAPPEPAPPAHPAPPAQPVAVVAGAAGEAQPIDGGLRVTFGAGSADLNPETDAALQEFAHDAAAKQDATITVIAHAAGSSDDPSTPRRLSLSRALVVRAVLLAEGIESTRIYLRALGSPEDDDPADRVDLTVGGGAPGHGAKEPEK